MDFETINLIRILMSRGMIFLTDTMVIADATQRQILYRLEKINDVLMLHSQEIITIGGSKEFIIPDNTRNFLIDYLYDQSDNENYYFNREERKQYIYLMLFINKEYISMQHLMQYLQISKSTIIQDMRELSDILFKSEISIEYDRIRGYYLKGFERLIRKEMMHIVMVLINDKMNHRVLNHFIKDHKLESFEYMKLIIEELAEKYEIKFVEDRLIEFIYIFIMIKARISSNQSQDDLYEDIPTIDLMNNFKEHEFTKSLFIYFFDNVDHEVDIQYLTSWILGISVSNVEESSADLLFIGDLVGKIIRRFEVISGTQFQDPEQIFRHVFSHFRPAYYRLLFKHPIINPLLDTIVNEYSELYSIVKETMKPFIEILGSEIPEEEIAYLTMHFSSVYNQKKRSNKRKYKGLIVCLNGVGSSVILYNELRSMFDEIEFYRPLEASKFNLDDYQTDVIFTTHYFKELRVLNVPVIKVSPVMDAMDKFQIIQDTRLSLGIDKNETLYVDGVLNVIRNHFEKIDNEPKLKSELMNVLMASKNEGYEKPLDQSDTLRFIDMIQPSRILLNVKAENWKDAIQIISQPLLRSNIISESYIKAMTNMHESEVSYFVIAPLVAIPHTTPNHGAYMHAFSMGVLEEPISFGDKSKPVKYVFCLSAPDNHTHISAMAEFLDIINRPCFNQVLDNARSVDEIYTYFLSNI